MGIMDEKYQVMYRDDGNEWRPVIFNRVWNAAEAYYTYPDIAMAIMDDGGEMQTVSAIYREWR